MSEMLGILDALEATILEAKKIPFSEKVVISEHVLLRFIGKIRAVYTSEDTVRKVVDQSARPNQEDAIHQAEKEAEKEAKKFREDAKDYADFMFSHVRLLITKMQTNLVNMERHVDNSRQMIADAKKGDNHEPTA